MPLQLTDTDILDFESLPALQPGLGNSLLPAPVVQHHPRAGSIRIASKTFSYIHISDILLSPKEDIAVRCTRDEDIVAMSFVRSGNMQFELGGTGTTSDMSANQHNLVYTPEAGTMHRTRAGHPVSSMTVLLDKQFFKASITCCDHWSEQVLNCMEQQRPFLGYKPALPTTHRMQLLMESILNCEETGMMRNLLLQSRVLELLALQIEQFRGASITDPLKTADLEKLHQVKQFIELHYLSDLSLQQLSRVSLLNEFKLKKGFRQLFGTTLFSYIQRLRMEHASLLLKDTRDPIDEIAYIVGYAHPHHFSTAFKKYFGITPVRYRTAK